MSRDPLVSTATVAELLAEIARRLGFSRGTWHVDLHGTDGTLRRVNVRHGSLDASDVAALDEEHRRRAT